MMKAKFSVVFMIILALAVIFIGCAKPPDAEKKAAEDAMNAAVAAGADKYAVADLDAAKGMWNDAEAKMTAKNYAEAKKGYMDAKAGFEKAAGGVDAGKKAMMDANTAMMAGADKMWKDMEAMAKKMGKKMKPDQKKAWAADEKAIMDGMKAAKDMNATDPAGAKAKMNDVKAMADKWDNMMKEMSAPVKKVAAAKPAAAKPAKKAKK